MPGFTGIPGSKPMPGFTEVLGLKPMPEYPGPTYHHVAVLVGFSRRMTPRLCCGCLEKLRSRYKRREFRLDLDTKGKT